MGALIAAFTVGQGFAKNIGINNSNYIVYWVGRTLSYVSFSKRKKVRGVLFETEKSDHRYIEQNPWT